MISIYINNQLADYFGDITIKKDNPLFSNFDVEPTEHTYTLTLPTTATNVKIFSLIQYTLATPQKLPARIEIDGVPVLEGSCNVQSWNDSGYSVYFSGIAPYEDVNISPIKKMLGDTRLLGEVLRTNKDWYPNGIYIENYREGVFIRENDNPAVVVSSVLQGYIDVEQSTPYIYNTILSNFAFNCSYLCDKIASAYGFQIDLSPNLDNVFVYANDVARLKFIGEKYYAPEKSLPNLTAKTFLQNIAIACGCRINIDLRDNKITFIDLGNTEFTANKLQINSYSLDWANEFANVGEIKYKDIEEDKGERGQTEFVMQYSSPNGIFIKDKEKKLHELAFSYPMLKNESIVVPLRGEEKEDEVKDMWLVSYNENDTYLSTPPQGVNLNLPGKFQLLKNIANRHTSLKLTARINPIQFTTLNLWQPIYVDNIGKVFVKSISFKSNGESEIEGYLY